MRWLRYLAKPRMGFMHPARGTCLERIDTSTREEEEEKREKQRGAAVWLHG